MSNWRKPLPRRLRAACGGDLQKVATPGRITCADVAEFLGLPLIRTVKVIAIVLNPEAAEAESPGQLAMILLRGDHNLNEVKAAKHLGEFRFAREDEIIAALGCQPGYLGPVAVGEVAIYVDRSVAVMGDFVCGANEAGYHLTA
jgi:prolyl-tRNA synthetase